MVEFNKYIHNDKPKVTTPSDNKDDISISKSEQRLRDELAKLLIIWRKIEDYSYDSANNEYAEGVGSCIEDLEDLMTRNAIT